MSTGGLENAGDRHIAMITPTNNVVAPPTTPPKRNPSVNPPPLLCFLCRSCNSGVNTVWFVIVSDGDLVAVDRSVMAFTVVFAIGFALGESVGSELGAVLDGFLIDPDKGAIIAVVSDSLVLLSACALVLSHEGEHFNLNSYLITLEDDARDESTYGS